MSQTFTGYPTVLTESLVFPPVKFALNEPNGLLAVGGDLTSERIIEAYRHGIFPWFSEHDPILWWSPSPRAIIPTDKIHVNKTLKKVVKRNEFTVSVNQHFEDVIRTCANAPFRTEETWILDPMIEAYVNLHKQGYAHSIEVHKDNELVGGLYGIAINGYFSGESMFYCENNASKIALLALSKMLLSAGISFIDCQIQNDFLKSMGCIEVSRDRFIDMKTEAMDIKPSIELWQAQTLPSLQSTTSTP